MPILVWLVTAGVVACLLGLAVLHLYWARGGTWPGRTSAELVSMVVGSSPGVAMPGPLACSVVAVLLASAAVLIAGVGVFEASAWPWRVGSLGVASVLGLRGLGGYLDARLRPETHGQPYEALNRRLYSPLCLVLAAAIVWIVWTLR